MNKPPVLGGWVNGGFATLDLPRLMVSRMLIQAESGGGKSWALRRLFEITSGLVQQIIIDPEGEFASLRERHDLVIVAANGGDALAHPKTAALLATRLLETGVSAVIDIYELKKSDRELFVKIFIDALVNAPKALWHPLLIAIDEVHMFCDESEQAISTQSIIDLATRGRKRGFCLVAATQRIADFNKSASAQLKNKLIGGTTQDTDVKRTAFELGMSPKEALPMLRGLNPGEFYAIGPALTKQIAVVKIGGVSTTHPEVGGRQALIAPKPTKAILAILPKLADLPKEAEEEARTVATLQRDLATARRELTQLKQMKIPAPVVPVDTSKLQQEAWADGRKTGWDDCADKVRPRVANLEALITQANTAVEAIRLVIRNGLTTEYLPSLAKLSTPRVPVFSNPPQYSAKDVEKHAPTNGDLSGPEQRIVDAIAWLESLGIDPCQQTAVAFLAKYTYGGGAFNNPRGRLKQRGFVEYVGGDKIRLTDQGRYLANAPTEALTDEELHSRVLGQLGGPEQRLLRPLLDAYPESMTNDDLATAANYAAGAGAFNNPRGRLKSLGLIEYLGGGQVKASAALFPGEFFMTYTYALMEISTAAYREIREKMLAVGYGHAINQAGEIDMHGIAVVANEDPAPTGTYPTPPHGWTCFHCGETFPGNLAGHNAARLHFGASIYDEPKCQISAQKLREMERQLRLYREEDSDLHREIARLRSAHATALRQEEEKGYGRGVTDRTAEFKNFHRVLCERFGYSHDPLDWQRDQLSLIEHIAGAGRGSTHE